MSRLIDADKLKAHYAWWKGGTREMTMDEAKNDFDTIIDLQPTVELKPIEIDGEEYLTGADYNAYLKGYKDGRAEPFKDFAEWVASEVCNVGFEEMWSLGAFAEVACRKLYALGIVQKFRDEWVYVDKDEMDGGEK